MRLIRAFFAAFVVTLMVAFAAPAHAQLRVDIEEGHLNPMPMAVNDFMGGNPAAQQVGRDVAGVIRANLERSALFRPIPSSAFIERITAMEVPPRFADWRIIDAQALVVGQVHAAAGWSHPHRVSLVGYVRRAIAGRLPVCDDAG
jgi:TolB protein